MKRVLQLLLLIFLHQSISSVGQTSFTVSPNTICGTTDLTVQINNPLPYNSYKAFLNGSLLGITPAATNINSGFSNNKVLMVIEGSKLAIGANLISVVGYRSNIIKKVPNNTITIDGILNENWVLDNNVGYVMDGPSSTATTPRVSTAANFGMAWDDNNLYIASTIIDNTPNTQGSVDGLEIYIDPASISNCYFWAGFAGGCNVRPSNSPTNNEKLARQIIIPYNSIKNNFEQRVNTTHTGGFLWPSSDELDLRDTTGLRMAITTFSGGKGYRRQENQTAQIIDGTGYNVELVIPWSNFYGRVITPVVNASFKFDFAVNDNQFGSSRNEQTFWYLPNQDNNLWFNSSNFGSVSLGGTTVTENLIGVITINGLQTPSLQPNISFSGDCNSALTVTDNSTLSPNSVNYWQTTSTGIENTDPSATPKVLNAPITTNTLYLNSLNTLTGCWSKTNSFEIIPQNNSTSNPNSILLSYPECGKVLFSSAKTVAGAANNLIYWQTDAINTSASGSNLFTIPREWTDAVTPITYYLRTINTLTGCWSNDVVSASGAANTTVPDVPLATITGVEAGACKGYKLSYNTDNTITGVNWYWQTTFTGTAKFSKEPSYTATTTGTYYLNAEDRGCWSMATTTTPSIVVQDFQVGPSVANVAPLDSSFCNYSTFTLKTSTINELTNKGQVAYWQTSPTATSTVSPAFNKLIVTSTGATIIYYNALSTASGCWGIVGFSGNYTVAGSPPKPDTVFSESGSLSGCQGIRLRVNTISGDAGFAYYWQSTPNGTSIGSNLNPITASVSGTYYVRTKTLGKDCWSDSSASISVKIATIPPAPAAPTILAQGCGNTTITSAVTPPSGTSFFWQLNDSSKVANLRGQNLVVTTPGENTYFVRLRSDTVTECWSNTSAEIKVTIGVTTVPSPIVNEVNSVQNEPTFTLTVGGANSGTTINWFTESTGGTGSTLAPSINTANIGTQTYYVTFSQDYCESERKAILVTISEAIINLKPNIGITPNGDDKNQFWVIDYIQNYPKNKLTILDKWGNSVFEANNYANTFEGKKDGNDLPAGTYYYVLDLGNGKSPQAGSITIIR
jgi:gliding motility-associated-like protein